MDTNEAKATVEEFKALAPTYEAFGRSVRGILEEALHSLPIHSITLRVKDVGKLEEKLTRPGKSYGRLQDVTDLVGVRVITYFEDAVDRVIDAIEREFDVDPALSVDKRKSQEPDRFGYVSVHKICRHQGSRVALTEYRKFGGLCCEIQVRSILQHAWAEMEHDLGYKGLASVPVPVRRRFSRLAGLLELADEEFVRIRKELDEYSQEVNGAIETKPESIMLDRISLRSFIESSKLCAELDRQCRLAVKAEAEAPENSWIGMRVEDLHYVGIESVKDLADALEAGEKGIRLLIGVTYRALEYRTLPAGISLFLLAQVLLGKRDTIDDIERGLTARRIGATAVRRTLAELLFQAARA